MLKKIISVFPGFRTGRIWKKIIACFAYPVLIFAIIVSIIGSNDASVPSMDNNISKWESVALIIFFIVIPFIFITNIGKVRSKLPLFKSGSIFKKTMAWIISCIVLFIGFGLTNSFLSKQHSPEYIAMQQEIGKEHAEKDAEEKANKNAEKLALQEEKAKKEAEAKAKKDAENIAQQQAKPPDEKAVTANVTVSEPKKVETPDNPATTVETTDVSVEQSLSTDNPKTSITKAVSGWFSGLFNRPKTDETDKANKKIIESFEKSLKKDDSKNMVNIYNSSNEEIKKYIEERINTQYFKNIKDNKAIILSKDVDKINKFYGKLEFINEISNLKDSDVGTVLADIKNLIEANNALVNFKKEHPNLKYGIIQDNAQVQKIDCYVNYRIKNTATKIGSVSIENDSYTDKYLISSYTYSQYLGYTPSEDWEAVLQLSSNSNITQAGTYKTNVISNGTNTLIDNKGFKKDYPQYLEVSQDDIAKYNQVKELIDQQSQLNSSIDEHMNHISERLS